MENISNMVK